MADEKKKTEAWEDEVADLQSRLLKSESHAAALAVQIDGSPRMMGLRETLGRAWGDREALRRERDAALDALQALTNPEGHLWHGGNPACTGECADARAVLQKAGRL